MVTIKKVVAYVLDAIAQIGSILYLLNQLGILPEPLLGVEHLSGYFVIFVPLALLIWFLSALWLGYQIHAHRTNTASWSKGQISTVDERFRRLTFHFSRITDTAKGSHEKPNYVVNMNSKQAYPIPNELEPYLKHVTTNSKARDGENDILNYFKTNHIEPHPEDPDIERDLGLVMGWDGLLHLPDLDLNALLSRLNGRKIKRAMVFNFYPWYRYSRPFSTASNRLLIIEDTKKATKEAWWTFPHDLDLIQRNLIGYCTNTKINYKLWCWLHHYKYIRKQYDEDKLIELLGE